MIRDEDGAVIGYLTFDLISGMESDPIVITVDIPVDGRLQAGSSAIFTVMARENGTVDPYVDLSVGLDLSGYTPATQVQFDLKVVAEAVSGRLRDGVGLAAVAASAAGWVT